MFVLRTLKVFWMSRPMSVSAVLLPPMNVSMVKKLPTPVAVHESRFTVIGVIESFVGGSSFSNYRDAIAFVILILVLLIRPAGLLGRNVAEKV